MQQLCFGLFVLLFFRYAQADVLAYQCSLLIGRSVTLWPWTTAALLTLLVLLLTYLLKLVVKKWKGNKGTVYVLAAGVLAVLTSIPLASAVHQWMVGLLTIALVVALELSYRCYKRKTAIVPTDLWRKNAPKALEMLLALLLLGSGNGVTDLQHYELRTAQALQSGHPEAAFSVGEKSYATSPRLFSMRCYLLATAHKKGLGDRLFEQMVPAGGATNLLLPTDDTQELLFPARNLSELLGSTLQPREQTLAYFKRCALHSDYHLTKHRRAAVDYYLSALLLERKLELFATEVNRYYPKQVAEGKLPTYFAQALLLYTHTTPHPLVDYNDNNTEANYLDYAELSKSTPNAQVRASKLRESYGETYWWWYTYGER